MKNQKKMKKRNRKMKRRILLKVIIIFSLILKRATKLLAEKILKIQKGLHLTLNLSYRKILLILMLLKIKLEKENNLKYLSMKMIPLQLDISCNQKLFLTSKNSLDSV